MWIPSSGFTGDFAPDFHGAAAQMTMLE